jgi:D-amino-acid dehydrogenase
VKVCILGAGIVGIASAYYLNKAGHEVTVIDRESGAGLDTSFANGGQISACNTIPWANPHVPMQLVKWLGRKDAPLLFHFSADPMLWSWLIKFLMNCRSAKALEGTAKNMRMSLYSRDMMDDIRANTGIDYDYIGRGILNIQKSQKDFEEAVANAAHLRELGLNNVVLGAEACIQLEPTLETVQNRLAGGVHTPEDESGDAHTFTRKLALAAASRGVVFRYNETVTGLEEDAGRVTRVLTNKGGLDVDTVVLSLGAYGPALLKPLGLNVPIYPAKGYSMTLPTAGRNGAPTISITDEEHKLVFTRLGDRLRVAGTVEFAGFNKEIDQERAQSLRTATEKQFPNAGDFEQATYWTGLRPLTPDCVPIIGRTKLENLYLNTGHGSLGWTMGAGSGKAISDLISGAKADIDLSGYGLERF